MRRAFTTTVAHAIAAGAAAVTMVGIALELATPAIDRYGAWPNALAVLGLVGGLTGALIAARSPRNVLAWLLCAGAAFAALNVLGGAAAAWLLVEHPDSRWIPWAAWLAAWTWSPPALITVAYIPQVFPGRRPLAGPFWRWWWRISLGLGAVMIALPFAAPYVPAFPGVANPVFGAYLSPEQFAETEPALGLALTATTIILMIVSIVALAVRFRRSTAAERRQIQLVVATTIALLIATTDPGSWWAAAAAVVFLASILYSVARLRLWEIDALIPRAVVGVGVVIVLGTLYLGVVAGIGALFGESAGSVVAAFTGAVIVGVLFEPLRRQVTRLVDRAFAFGRPDTRTLAADLSRAAREAEGGRQALDRVAERLRDALHTPGLALELGPPGSTRYRTDGDGDEAAPVDVVPVSWHGEEVARVLVPPRRAATTTRRSDRLALVELEPTLGLIAHDVLVGLDLELARETAVTAREDELRRLRRDLHDGLGPLLAGAALSVEVARDGVASSARADEGTRDRLHRLLSDAAGDLHAAITEIRELVYGLRPPALDDLGLAAAVRNLFPDPPFRLTVSLEPERAALPAAVEVAAYRIAQEALTNVARHAQASRAAVTFRVQPGRAVVTVEDDGVGLGAMRTAGVGLASMRERAAELGGRVSIAARADGGTVVTAVLPLADSRSAPGANGSPAFAAVASGHD